VNIVLFALITRRDGESPLKLKKLRGASQEFFRHNKDVVNYEAACSGRGILEGEKKKGHGGVRVW